MQADATGRVGAKATKTSAATATAPDAAADADEFGADFDFCAEDLEALLPGSAHAALPGTAQAPSLPGTARAALPGSAPAPAPPSGTAHTAPSASAAKGAQCKRTTSDNTPGYDNDDDDDEFGDAEIDDAALVRSERARACRASHPPPRPRPCPGR